MKRDEIASQLATLTPERRAQLLKRLQQGRQSATAPGAARRPPLLPASRDAPIPASFAQEDHWLFELVEGPATLVDAIRLRGPLSIPALKGSIANLVARHEVLRTTLAEVDGNLVQTIAPEPPVDFPIVDRAAVPKHEREEDVRTFARELARVGFDLTRGPLLRMTLLRFENEEHALVVAIHHAAFDAWSFAIFYRELFLLYALHRDGAEGGLPPLAIQYADYAIWQRNWLRGEVLERELSYWTTRLASAPSLEIPTDRPRPARRLNQGAECSFAFGPEATRALRGFCLEERSTVFAVLLGGLNALLSRYSGQDDIVIGTTMANRPTLEVESLIGPFISGVVLRADLGDRPTGRTLVRRTQDIALEAQEHLDVPFSRIVRELRIPRDPSRTPLYQIMFILMTTPSEPLSVSGLEVEAIAVDRGIAPFDLTLWMRETQNELEGYFEYSTALFDASTIERMASHLKRLVEGLVTNPTKSVHELPILTEAERRRMLFEWNDTPARFEAAPFIHRRIEEQVTATPDAIAMTFEEHSVTYSELNGRANRLAASLGELGVGADVLVGVCLDRSAELIIAVLAVLKTGGAYLPLDPGYPAERLRFMCEDSEARVLITTQNGLLRLPGVLSRNVCLDSDPLLWSRPASKNAEGVRLAGDHLAYVIYTSGSTGRPKGTLNTHDAIRNRLLWMQQALPIGPSDAVLQKTPFSFDVSVWELFWPLMFGARLVIALPDGHRDPKYLVDLITREGVTTAHFVPSMMRAFLEVVEPECCTLLRQVICSGEALASELNARFFASLPARLHNLYGPTEAAVDVSWWACVPQDSDKAVPIGRPIANTQLYVLDPWQEPTPIGVTGQLHIGGIQLARGYLNRSDLTAERFIPNAFGAGRLYRTGDLARYAPSGDIEFLGRIDHQVKIRGFRIELGEIETVLMRQPGVRECVVVACDADSGKSTRLVAYAAPRDLDVRALRAALESRLPEYLIPSLIMALDALPLNLNGKVDRNALPKPNVVQTQERYVAPRNPIEQLLTSVWAELLDVERIGVHDNFFEVGGHSLLAMQVVARIRKKLAVEVPVRALFEAPTVAQLAELLPRSAAASDSEGSQPIGRVGRHGPMPLSSGERRLWFLDQFQPGTATYNLHYSTRLRGRLDYRAVDAALGALVSRHESLRTRFVAQDGEPDRVIDPPHEFKLDRFVVDPNSEGNSEGQAKAIVTGEANRPFDLAAGPLFRATLVHLSDEDHLLLLVMHHIVSDGWSIGVLAHELSALYSALRDGKESPLQELAIQYADYAAWERAPWQDKRLQEQSSYWKQRLTGLPVLDLPADRPRPSVQSTEGAAHAFELGSPLVAGLRALSRREGSTLFMTLLAGFSGLLSRYSGQLDFGVGTPVAHRTRLEMEPVVGFFVNTLVMRVNLTKGQSTRELLGQLREEMLSGYANQDVSFERLVEDLQLTRDLSHTPLFQVMFTLQNDQPITLPKLEVESFGFEVCVAKFDLTLSCWERPDDSLGCEFEYATALFDASTIYRMEAHLRLLLERIVAAPRQPIQELQVLGDAERHRMMLEWNDTVADFPRKATLLDLFESQAALTPDAVAVVGTHQLLTYRELDARANALGRRLQRADVGPETLVGVCLERTPALVVALLAILKAGGGYVPLDPLYPRDRLAFMLDDAKVVLVLTDESSGGALPHGGSPKWLLSVAQADNDAPARATGPDNLAYVIYTSGSTGKPKGVTVTHGALINLLTSVRDRVGFRPSEVLLAITSLSFDIAGLELYLPLITGGQVVLAERMATQDGHALLQLLKASATTFIQATPSTWRLLLEAGLPQHSNVRALCGGEAVPASLAKELSVAVTDVWNVYGPTETTIWSTLWRIPDEPRKVSIGRALANTQLCVLDDAKQPTPVGVTGELYIGGLGLARGYYGRPDLTAERFVPNPFGAGRLYRTGDLARYLTTGNVEFLGRTDHQIKLRGFRIELGEIEGALMREVDVRESVVVARDDKADGKCLVAYVVPSDVDVRRLRAGLQAHLPEHMIPAFFVPMSALPRTPNGKLDRKALPAPDTMLVRREYAAPRTPTEERIAAVWSDVLGLERVGVTDDFFELGGNSLLTTRAMARIRKSEGVDLPLVTLFKSPTVAKLAEVVRRLVARSPEERGPQDVEPPLIPAAADERLQTSLVQERHIARRYSFDTISYALRLVGPLNVDVLKQALNSVVARHESLRTTFRLDGTKHVQVIARELSLSLPVEDLRACVDPSAELEQRARHDRTRAFDLNQGPVLRANLLRMATNEYVLLLSVHHIASDAWSMGIFFRELFLFYDAFCEGRSPVLPALPIQYADYAAWQRRWWASSGDHEQQLSYWRQQLANPPALKLRTDHPRPSTPTFRAASQDFAIGNESMAALRALGRREGCTLFMMLLTAYSALLCRRSGQTDILVWTTVANRHRVGVEGLIGPFYNALCLRADLSGNPTGVDLLSRIRQTALAAYQHPDVRPFVLIDALGLAPDPSRPRFQAMLELFEGRDTATVGEIEVTWLDLGSPTLTNDCNLEFVNTRAGLSGNLRCNGDLFEVSTVVRMSQELEAIVSALATRPELPIV